MPQPRQEPDTAPEPTAKPASRMLWLWLAASPVGAFLGTIPIWSDFKFDTMSDLWLAYYFLFAVLSLPMLVGVSLQARLQRTDLPADKARRYRDIRTFLWVISWAGHALLIPLALMASLFASAPPHH